MTMDTTKFSTGTGSVEEQTVKKIKTKDVNFVDLERLTGGVTLGRLRRVKENYFKTFPNYYQLR